MDRGEQGVEQHDAAVVVIYLGFAELHGEPWLPWPEQRLLVHEVSEREGVVEQKGTRAGAVCNGALVSFL